MRMTNHKYNKSAGAIARALRDRARAGTAMESELIAFCRERLIKWSCPREVAFVDALPLTKVGKIDYRELVRLHEQNVSKKESA